jgi:hypothetical protein
MKQFSYDCEDKNLETTQPYRGTRQEDLIPPVDLL